MGWFKRKSPEEERVKNITEKMEQAIKLLEEKSKYRENAIRSRAIRQVESRMDEITNYMITNMKTPIKIHSQEFNISDIFGVEDNETESIMNILKGGEDNIFGKFLCDNKLTMALDSNYKKVKFAYGTPSLFEYDWFEWAGYDLYLY